jgi:tetratricopeptide (TPR) repeat protein
VNGGDPRVGVADLRAFVEASPQHPDVPSARRMINETLARYGDRQELQDTYTALMTQSPTTAEAINDAAGIAGRLARAKDQEAAWKKLRAQFPDHPLAHRAALDLANASFKRKEYRDAATQAQAATKSEEDGVRAEAFLLSGESELKLKRFPIAAKAFEAAADVKSADAAIRYRALAGLGLAREEQREWRAALVAYESVAARSPDPTLRDWAKERVTAVKQRLSDGGAAKPKSGS